MINHYKELAYAIVNQAVCDFFFFRHKGRNIPRYKRAVNKLKAERPPFNTEEYERWRKEIQRAEHKLYRIKDADEEMEDIEYSMKEGEINKLMALLDFPITGKEMYQIISAKTVRPKQLRRYVVKVE